MTEEEIKIYEKIKSIQMEISYINEALMSLADSVKQLTIIVAAMEKRSIFLTTSSS